LVEIEKVGTNDLMKKGLRPGKIGPGKIGPEKVGTNDLMKKGLRL